ncbi:MAG: anaerobic ribonucleoside-triphosphate reductase activating protein [Clostridia bacterium]|nr:anaerobic ribonucleoside-triphosphate reductase activating protein [Clostridia bacterium]
MNIQGLQKLTLLDFPGKMACTIFTAGCDLRCPFCHNRSLVINPPAESEFSEDEFFSFLKKRKGILEGVAITGGEPLMQVDIEDFIIRIRELGYAVKLDTNGTFPARLKSLVEKGLVDYVAMDVKSSESGYPSCVGIGGFKTDKINESIEFLKSDKVDYEFRTTVAKGLHTKEDIEQLGRWIQGAKRHFLQAFTDSGDLIGFGLEPFSKAEMLEMCEIMKKYVPSCEVRGI